MSITTVTVDNFQQEVLESEKVVLVDFWAPWCGPCRNLSPIIDEIAEERTDIKVGKINIDDFPELTAKYYIEYVPTLVIFSEGDLIDFVISPGSKDAIAQFVEESL